MSGQSAGKAKYRESNNHPQGRTGSKVKTNPGPAKGNRGIVNPTKKGGVFRKPKSN